MLERDKVLKNLIDRYFFSSRQARDRRLLNNVLKAFGGNSQDESSTAKDSSPASEEQKPKTLGWLSRLQQK